VIKKYNLRADAAQSLVCVGLDSDFEQIPASFRKEKFPQFAFNKHIVDLTHQDVAAYKPNIAFYESRGEEGMHALKLTMEYIQKTYPDIIMICDAKRGDTVNTNKQYARELFDWFGFDAVTLSPYLGKEPLAPFLARKEKGCIILCRTSNPGAREVQDLTVGGKPLWQIIAEKVRDEWNENGNCLLVVGATYPEEMVTLRKLMGDMTFLVPGVGTQGGDIEKMVRAGLSAKKKGMIVNSSRGIIFAKDPAREARQLKDAINAFR
jgi:orotidine-5'-phosphate decarboxylase